ncbi:hypothetical protein QQ045_023713 [Rhodiola kirilowii]
MSKSRVGRRTGGGTRFSGGRIGGFLRNLGGDIERQVGRTRSRDSSDVAVVVEAIHELLLSKVTGNRRTQTRFLQGSKMG